MAYVYKHIRKDNNQPFYIGVGGLISFDNYQRALAKNWKGLRSRSEFWQNYVNLYGFTVEIALDNCTVEEAFSKEVELIKLYGRQDINTGILVNHTNGGDGGFGYSEETKKKCGIKNKGKKQSIETIEKRKISLKNKPPDSKETRMKKSIGNKGKKKSEEHKINITLSTKGRLAWNTGKSWSEETKRKMAENSKGSPKKVINRVTGKIYKNTREASKDSGYKYSYFSCMLSGKYKNTSDFERINDRI